jgi:hypothetical protein
MFALLFPLLIFNRDVFLLTLCCVLFKNIINKKIKIHHVAIMVAAFLFLFAQVGKLRSGNVQSIIDLPTKFDLEAIGLIGFWAFTYFTSPMFNVHYNFEDEGRDLYEPLLTVFPEFYKFIEAFSFFGLYLYVVIGAALALLPALIRFPGWMCFSYFFYYQFTMGCVFSNKLINTHSIYIVLIFMTMTITRQVLQKRDFYSV